MKKPIQLIMSFGAGIMVGVGLSVRLSSWLLNFIFETAVKSELFSRFFSSLS